MRNRPFDAELLVRELPAPPLTTDALITASRALKFRIRRRQITRGELARWTMPCLVEVWDTAQTAPPQTSGYNSTHLRTQASDAEGPETDGEGIGKQRAVRLALVAQINTTHVLLFRAGSNQVSPLSHEEFGREFAGVGYQLAPAAEPIDDPDGLYRGSRTFGFRWFIPELLKHRRVWRDVLIASLFIQVLALGTPVFTQVVIDKVVVHRTQSTLIVIGIGMGLFAIFSTALTWIRQYLVLHTGNRVDAVLGAAVFDHILKLPTRYY